MTSSIELFSAQQQFAVAGEAFVRELIHESVVSQVVAQSELKVLENPTEESVAPELKEKSFPSTTFTSPRRKFEGFSLPLSSCRDSNPGTVRFESKTR